MKQVTAKQFLCWCCGDKDAAASILTVSKSKMEEMIEFDQVLDAYSNRLVNYLMSQYHPQTKEDALRIALHRAEVKLSRAYQSITSMDPVLDL
jgi:hypothetical protein